MQIKQVNGIYRTECLSFPRAGQEALRGALTIYFGDRLNWSEPYKFPESNMNTNPETNFMKNHDHELKVPVREDRKYIVLIRDPFEAIQSWHRMETDGGNEPAEWNEFWKDKIQYYAGFTNKWIIDPVPNRVIVRYEMFTRHPVFVFAGIVKHITEGESIDQSQIAEVASSINPRETWRLNEDRKIQTL